MVKAVRAWRARARSAISLFAGMNVAIFRPNGGCNISACYKNVTPAADVVPITEIIGCRSNRAQSVWTAVITRVPLGADGAVLVGLVPIDVYAASGEIPNITVKV